ncbi:hypothetical protein E4U42_004563 [Claviceps africana]|uniref:Uncharacterized protein n=1 Tax=Claviceps africana TaxID=83212 RepID=A0A8K0J530_9HYPO|nr:hypothetical protein E4U42_004563 [Claviceps africana]
MNASGHRIMITMEIAEPSQRQALWDEFDMFIHNNRLAYRVCDQGLYWKDWEYTGPADADSSMETCEDAKKADCFFQGKKGFSRANRPWVGWTYELMC